MRGPRINGPDALIGHTGFVGGNLLRQREFPLRFNSRTIGDARSQAMGHVVCAGVSAVKWMANKEPEDDWRGIQRLIDVLKQVNADHFTLISTIDVYGDPSGQTEADVPPTEGLHPYGRHRLALETFVAERFPSHAIVRLPALFGSGLKKNAIYDLMHLNQTDRIIPNAAFQWYPLNRLADDLDTIRDAAIGLINITSEPILMSDVRDRFFPDVAIDAPVDKPPRYDLRTRHDRLLGGANGYHLSAAQVWEALAAFLAAPEA